MEVKCVTVRSRDAGTAAVAQLASDEAGFVTGAVIDVNGGAFMGG